MAVPIVTVAVEGGYYSPDKRLDAPIIIFSDRRVFDKIARGLGVKKWRCTLSRKEFRRVKKAALENRARGYV
jgi:hypothetical protein